MQGKSPLEILRLSYQPELPPLLQNINNLESIPSFTTIQPKPDISPFFPKTAFHPLISFKMTSDKKTYSPLKVGVVFSGGQAPGGHNVIWGLLDGLLKCNPQSRLIGFLEGPKGIIDNKFKELTPSLLKDYRNLGGFDLIGSGRDKIETPEQFQATETTVKTHQLDGLVIIGGDDSHTNVALLAEHFAQNNIPCSVVGVPKTIDGDLRNEYLEMPFGFDTACKIYSEEIGNIARDALSAKKYFFFIKLMGRSASHVTLECALQTHPNMALISEEIAASKKTLKDLTNEIADLICQRADKGKNYGVILIPEGIIEFLPKSDLLEIPPSIQNQLSLECDPHGNVQVSKIETERLFIELVKQELERRANPKVKFNPQPIFYGYEGRTGMPTNFDCRYCYALGHVAALLIASKASGYMAVVENLTEPLGVPIVPLMHLEQRKGKTKPVVKKALVDLSGKEFLEFQDSREQWALEDHYRYPGPIQFYVPH